jgi:anti-sigma factor (TIGR02949 family)
VADDEIDCDRALVELYQFLDGELTIERRQRIEVHLHGCQHCFSSFDFEQEFRMVVRSKLRAEIPPSLMERIVQLIEHEGGGMNHSEAG